LSALALSVGVPETRLADEFFRLRGCSIREWVRRERMDDSIRELVWSSDAVDRVAVRAGYHDAPHFIREFKRATGSTPGSFRKSCREAMLS
jgi:AraC-like DNA-binding protein